MNCKSALANTKQDQTQNQFYGRKQGRPLSASRKQALDKGLKAYGISDSLLVNKAALKPDTLFQDPYPSYQLEIGFGDGKHLSALMKHEPETGFIGVEPYTNGMSSFLKDISPDKPRNISVYMDDAMQLVPALSDKSLDKIYILNPDPWHKKRHFKRRIVNPDNLDEFARILKPNGKLILSTDVPYLADWMFVHTYNHSAFTWHACSSRDWKKPPENWITTTYEKKGAKGAKIMSYFIFEKKP